MVVERLSIFYPSGCRDTVSLVIASCFVAFLLVDRSSVIVEVSSAVVVSMVVEGSFVVVAVGL